MSIKIIRDGNPECDKEDWPYMLKHRDKEIGFVFLFDDDYVIGWNGKVDFSNLENIALQKVPRILSSENMILCKGPESGVKTCITYSENNEDEILELDFAKSNPKDLKKYNFLIRHHELIDFARYDIEFNDFQYGITAQNFQHPKIINEEYSEIAIKQPYSQQFTRDLLKWILETHKYSSEFQNLNIEDSAKQIKRVLGI